jgi:UDP-2,3-diacylglucosamine pyrophosphatase LpxH
VAHEAAKHGYQGGVCGQNHRAEIRDVDGVLYCNDGDWVESRSALVENEKGELSLLYWQTEPVVIAKPQLVKVA